MNDLAESLKRTLVATTIAIGLAACGDDGPPPAPVDSEATSFTLAVNREYAEKLDLDEQQGFEDASRGLIAEAPAIPIKDTDGTVIWDASEYDFVQGDAPPTVNPSLWRQSKLNLIRGLFKVRDGIYQLRGFDLANISIIEGDTGWIVVDPLTTEATAREAIAFARAHLGDQRISAILFTHSHIDHFGGALGLMSMEEARGNNVAIVAPVGFIEEATSENILAGARDDQARTVYVWRATAAQSDGPCEYRPRHPAGSRQRQHHGSKRGDR